MSELRERIERALHNVEYTAGEAAASMSSVAETLREALALLSEEREPVEGEPPITSEVYGWALLPPTGTGPIIITQHWRTARDWGREKTIALVDMRRVPDEREPCKECAEWEESFKLYDACVRRASDVFRADHSPEYDDVWPDGAKALGYWYKTLAEQRKPEGTDTFCSPSST
jgi:hypothetical protein